MKKYIKGKKVVDIGSGSGILCFVAMKMGASSVFGVEIDPQAIEHAKKNAGLNHMKVQFYLPDECKDLQCDVALMNMIFCEQKVAWDTIEKTKPKRVLTSGILNEEADEYLLWIKSKGWQLSETITEGIWRGFSLTRAISFQCEG